MSGLHAAPSSGSADLAASGVVPLKPNLSLRASRTKTNAGLFDLVADMAKVVDALRIEVRDGFDTTRQDLQILKALLLERLDGAK